MRFQVVDNYRTSLAAAVDDSATTLELSDVSRVPSDVSSDLPLALTLAPDGTANPALSEVEIVHVTAVDSGASTVTVSRGEGGSSAKAWDSGAVVGGRLPAHIISRFLQSATVAEQQSANASVNPLGFWLTHSPASGRGPEAEDAIALGPSARATAKGALAAGYNALASGTYSVALGGDPFYGSSPTASASGAFAFGTDAVASNTNAVAMGNAAESSGYSSMAIGYGAKATAFAANAFAAGTANGYYSFALGRLTTTNADYSFAVGKGNDAEGVGSSAFGHYAYAAKNGNMVHAAGSEPFGSGDPPLAFQKITAPFRMETADATTTSVETVFSATDILALGNMEGGAISFHGRVVAVEVPGGSDGSASWEFSGLAWINGTGSAEIVGSTVTQDQAQNGAGSWTVALTVSGMNLSVEVTGASSTDIRWAGYIEGAQIYPRDIS